MQKKALYVGLQFIRRKTGEQVKIEQVKHVLTRHGRTEQLSARYRMSGTNVFITATDLLNQYDEEQKQPETIKA